MNKTKIKSEFLPSVVSGAGIIINTAENNYNLPDIQLPLDVNQFTAGIALSEATNIAGGKISAKIENSLFEIGVNSLGPTNPDVTLNKGFPLSEFGQPFIGDITFCPNGQSYIDSNNLNGDNIKLDEINIKTCLITLNNQKSIIKTPVIGRDGSIKTYMNKGDYDITIDAIIVASDDDGLDLNGVSSYNGIYPYNVVHKLVKVCEASCPINIASDYLMQFGIINIVIDSYEISQEEGKYSQQKVMLKCYSDFAETYQSIINY